jgi:hypothetical protein
MLCDTQREDIGCYYELGFQKDVEILRPSINRPELIMQTARIPNGIHRKILELRFLFDNSPGQPILGLFEVSAHRCILEARVVFQLRYWF